MTGIEIASMISTGLVAGGWIVNVLTVKSQRKKSEAETKKVDAETKKVNADAESTEIDNVKKLSVLWEELSKKRAEEDAKVIAELKGMVNKMTLKMDKFIKAVEKASDCPGVENCIVLKELDKKDKN